jgi:hypothetical protein
MFPFVETERPKRARKKPIRFADFEVSAESGKVVKGRVGRVIVNIQWKTLHLLPIYRFGQWLWVIPLKSN